MSTILVVDDCPDVLDLYAEILEEQGHFVLRAGDGEEALRIATWRRPDLVITDLRMPRLDGLQLCRRLRQDPLLHSIPIVVQSVEPEIRVPFADAILSKACELEELQSLIDRMLASRRVGALAMA